MNYSKPEAKVILASKCYLYDGKVHTLYTVEAKIHRYVLAELNTHRAFSRNSASSRAIPISKQIESVENDIAMPLSWGTNKPGMQAGEELGHESVRMCQLEWEHARDNAVNSVTMLSGIGLHKQVVNRLLEPFLWHKVIISSTEWDNFFKQRCHKDAQPEIRLAAEAIKDAICNAEVKVLRGLNWHLPYITQDELEIYRQDTLKKISVARCARVSYNNHDGVKDVHKDLELFDKLRDGQHFSPFEHVATPGPGTRNFKGFVQYREEID